MLLDYKIDNYEQCPNVVLEFLLKVYRERNVVIKDDNTRQLVIGSLENYQAKEYDIHNKNHHQRIVCFINPTNQTWTRDKVIEAAAFYEQCMNHGLSSYDILRYPLSNPTNQHPKSIGLVLAYKHAIQHNIRFQPHSREADIYRACYTTALSSESLLRLINTLPLNKLFNIVVENVEHALHHIPSNREDIALYASNIKKNPQQLRAKDLKREYYIAWAAVKNGHNLYDFANPEYAISKYPNYEQCEWHCRHLTMQDINLYLTFDPRLPWECYKAGAMKSLLEHEGLPCDPDLNIVHSNQQHLVDNAIKRSYDLLVKQRDEKTFYLGKKHALNDETPIFMDDVECLEEEQCLGYGTYYQRTVMSINEWKEHFTNCQDFVDYNMLPISESAVNKLLRLTSNHEIHNIIISIRNKLNLLSLKEKEWIQFYRSHSTEMLEAMDLCMRLGMYMRGWEGDSITTYPLDGRSLLNSNAISLNVHNALISLYEYLEQHPNIKDSILGMDLKAVETVAGEIRVWTNSHNPQFVTLKDRLDIVMQGDSNDNIESCIRTSSNWIVGTIYHYGSLVGINYGFDFTQLRYIS